MTPSDAGDPTATALDLFTMRAERSASVVHRCTGAERLSELITALSYERPVAASPTFAARYPTVMAELRRTVQMLVPESPAELAGVGLGVSVGEALIAETGSVLVSERGLADRLVSMLAPALIQIVDEGAIVETLDEIGEMLQRGSGDDASTYFAIVTGPSRSADIERSLTIGVQGPAELHVVIYGTDQSPE